jgi:hypothetical protein
MPATETTHQGTTADNPFEVSRWMGEADRPMTWLRDEEALHGWARADLANGFANTGHGRPRMRLDQVAVRKPR